jgi:hypothetical protein
MGFLTCFLLLGNSNKFRKNRFLRNFGRPPDFLVVPFEFQDTSKHNQTHFNHSEVPGCSLGASIPPNNPTWQIGSR